MLIAFSDEAEKQIRERVSQSPTRKGLISDLVEAAVKEYLEKHKQ